MEEGATEAAAMAAEELAAGVMEAVERVAAARAVEATAEVVTEWVAPVAEVWASCREREGVVCGG